MEIVDKGVLEPSFMDFTIPSEFAKNALHYAPQFGHFYCNKEYAINRNSLDLYLLMYVCSGSLHVESRGRKIEAVQDQIVLLDCRYPHKYYCRDQVEFMWFHFNGNNSEQYGNYLYKQSGLLFEGNHTPRLKSDFEEILSITQEMMINEHQISMNITKILSILAVPEVPQLLIHHPLTPALRHIAKHFEEDIDLMQLSELCSVSISHFIRSFKRYTNCTPHEYLLSYRLRQSKQLLSTSSKSMEEIAEICGFNSASHFSRAFKKQEGKTPSEFRNMEF